MTTYNIPGVGNIAAGTAFEMELTVHSADPSSDPVTDIVRFPANYLENASAESLATLGITIVEAAEEAPQEPAAPTQADYARVIQAHLDTTAQSKLYSDAVSCAAYVSSSVPQWAAEATAFVLWRDNVWAYAYNQLAAVTAGTRTQPTVSELVAELPSIVWPEAAA